MKVKSLSVGLLATPWTAAYQAPLSVGFSRQEYWSGMPLPSLGSVKYVMTDSNIYFFMAEQYSIVYMYHDFFIHSSVHGHLDCIHVLQFSSVQLLSHV